jgi:hypothetical protein
LRIPFAVWVSAVAGTTTVASTARPVNAEQTVGRTSGGMVKPLLRE